MTPERQIEAMARIEGITKCPRCNSPECAYNGVPAYLTDDNASRRVLRGLKGDILTDTLSHFYFYCEDEYTSEADHYANLEATPDDGFLREASCKIRRHNPEGDMLTFTGMVKQKWVEDDRYLVEIEQEARNQDGELSVIGGGVVELRNRGG